MDKACTSPSGDTAALVHDRVVVQGWAAIREQKLDRMCEVRLARLSHTGALMDKRVIAIEQHLSEEQLPVFRENRKQYQMRDKARREREREGQKPSAWKPKWKDNPRAC